jgi:hypothetical protein
MALSDSVMTGAGTLVEVVVEEVVVLVTAGEAAAAEAWTNIRSLVLLESLGSEGGGAAVTGAGLVCACSRDNALSKAAIAKLNRLNVVAIVISGMK